MKHSIRPANDIVGASARAVLDPLEDAAVRDVSVAIQPIAVPAAYLSARPAVSIPEPFAVLPGSDFNHDNRSDIVWQNNSGQAVVWFMDGQALIGANAIEPNPTAAWHLKATGDFNNDGKADLLWQHDNGLAAIWLMDGTTLSGGNVIGPDPGPTWHIRAAGDFNGDGKSDLLWQNDNGEAAVWLMDGLTVTNGNLVGPNPGATWHGKAAADFNGDGKADILWQNDNGNAAVWLMDGLNLVSGDLVGPTPGPTWHVMVSGDFNGDSKADIAWQSDGGEVAVWLMDGLALLGGNVSGTLPHSGAQIMATGDYNGDGKSDLLFRSPDGTTTMWLMDGATRTSSADVGFKQPYPASVDLASLDGETGYKIVGASNQDGAGFSVAVGDVNSDGLSDIVIGAPFADPNGNNSGVAYVVYSHHTGSGAVFSLSGLNGANGFAMKGLSQAGFSVGSSLGTVLVGAPNPSTYGNVYALGSFNTPSVELSQVDTIGPHNVSGERFVGAVDDLFGRAVAVVTNFNGPNKKAYIVGAPVAHGASDGSGIAYLISAGSGSNNVSATPVLLKLVGTNLNDHAGSAVASAGDVNGDGYTDVIVGAPSANANGSLSGASYVVFGSAEIQSSGLTINLGALSGVQGFKISGVVAGDYSGWSVSSAGDVNGDGFADVIVGAKYASPHGSHSGAAYVVFGKVGGFGANLNLATLNGANGFMLSGAAADDQAGFSVAAAGDVNGDGFADVIVGARGADPAGRIGAGSSYVVFGHAGGFSANLDLSTLNGSNGFAITGAGAGDASGRSVSAGDVNGDGFTDLVIGAPYASSSPGSNTGAAYVLYGRAPGGAVNLTGSVAAQTLAGGDFDDVFKGLGGNDQLYGHGGSDTAVFTGAHTDYFIVNDARDGTVLVQDNRASSPDGTDSLRSIEKLQFSDGTFNLNDLVRAHPVFDDFDNDGRSDILWQSDADELVVWHVDGTTLLSSLTTLARAQGTYFQAGADFDSSGRNDLMVSEAGNALNTFALMNGGADPNVSFGTTNTHYRAKALGDLNGDGYVDILFEQDTRMPVFTLLHGTSPAGSGVVIGATQPSAGWHIKGAGDFNDDGTSDILWQNDDGAAAIWLLHADLTSHAPALLAGNTVGFNPGASWHVKGSGDFNDDGKSDILWQNDDGSVAVWLMNGLTMTGGVGIGTNPGPGWQVKGTGDFNGDGKTDILSQNVDGTAGMWLLDGTTLIGGGTVGPNLGTSWQISGNSDGSLGAHTLVFPAPSQSTGADAVKVAAFDAGSDVFKLGTPITGIDAAVTGGALSTASFDADLSSAVGGGQLASGHAVLFTPDNDGLTAHTYLVVDANGAAGYQSGADYVFEVTGMTGILTTDNFV